jgi:hypothetical protein
MTHSNKSISLLRQRMIDDMTMRKLSPKTQAGYLRAVIKFTLFFGRSPDLASSENLKDGCLGFYQHPTRRLFLKITGVTVGGSWIALSLLGLRPTIC